MSLSFQYFRCWNSIMWRLLTSLLCLKPLFLLLKLKRLHIKVNYHKIKTSIFSLQTSSQKSHLTRENLQDVVWLIRLICLIPTLFLWEIFVQVQHFQDPENPQKSVYNCWYHMMKTSECWKFCQNFLGLQLLQSLHKASYLFPKAIKKFHGVYVDPVKNLSVKKNKYHLRSIVLRL